MSRRDSLTDLWSPFECDAAERGEFKTPTEHGINKSLIFQKKVEFTDCPEQVVVRLGEDTLLQLSDRDGLRPWASG